MRNHGTVYALVFLVISALIFAACGAAPSPPDIQRDLINKLKGEDVYIPTEQMELNNYNKRQELADQPTTILWCTSAFDNPSSPMFTVAIIGKLTSGNKRPFPATQFTGLEGRTSELPGPDGMYGSSGEYRFGFGPADQYYDFYNMDTFCTTEPTVWQRESTTIVMATDPGLLEAQVRAQDAIASGDNNEAQRILEEAIDSPAGDN